MANARETAALYNAVSKALFMCPIEPGTEPYASILEAKMILDGLDPEIARKEAREPDGAYGYEVVAS